MELCIAWYLKNEKATKIDTQLLYLIGRIFLWDYKKLNVQTVDNKQTFAKKDIKTVYNIMKAEGLFSIDDKDAERVVKALNLLVGSLFWSEWRYGYTNETDQKELIKNSDLEKMSFEEVLKVGRVEDIKKKQKVKQ